MERLTMNKDDFLDMKPAKHGVVSAVEKRSRRAPERRTHERVLADERARILSIMQLPEAADLGDIALYLAIETSISVSQARHVLVLAGGVRAPFVSAVEDLGRRVKAAGEV